MSLLIRDYDKEKGWHYRPIKEREMEFDKSRVFTALNADELRAGDKVIVADQLSVLKQRVQEGKEDSAIVLQKINGDDWGCRFGFTMSDFALAYLVERKENCTNCDFCVCAERNWATELGNERIYCCPKYKPKTEKEDNMWIDKIYPMRQENGVSDHVIVAVEGCPYAQSGYYDFDLQAWFVDGCSEPVKVEAWQKVELPKTEQEAESHYRPFRDTDELIKVRLVWHLTRLLR